MATERIKRLREKVDYYGLGNNNPICIEKMKITLATEKEMSGMPNMLKRGASFLNVCKQIPISLLDDELLVGTPASKPWGLEIESCLGKWDEDELNGLIEDGFGLSEEDKAEVLRLNEEYEPWGMYQQANLVVRADERLDNFVQTGICLAPWKPSDKMNDNRVGGGSAASGLGLGPGWTLVCPDYEMALTKGFRKMIEECDEELRNHRFRHEKDFDRSIALQSMRMTLEGVIIFANRMADLAEEQAAACDDPQRKAELEQIAVNCRRVPAEPPETFWQALQFTWFIMVFASPSPTTPIGRADQYLYPYYRHDIDVGIITDADVVELLECFRLRCMEIHAISGREVRKRASGGARWYNMTIGGVHSDGSDATNELSYLVLDAVLDCPCIQHTVTIRVAESTPMDLIAKGVECQAAGCSMPAFVSDQSNIEYFMRPDLSGPGLTLEEARGYCMTGCIDGNIPGHARSAGVSMFVAPLVLDIFLNRGVCKNTGLRVGHDYGELDGFKTYDEFYEAFLAEFKHYIELACEKNNIENLSQRAVIPSPFNSVLLTDGIKVGLDMYNRTFPFENGSLINAVGVMNLAQSLYAINRIVYQDKLCTLGELKDILDADWEGHEDLRQYCIKLPHYGNDIDEVDQYLVDLYDFWEETATQWPSAYGGYTKCNAISVTSHGPGGALTGATPDGRHAGETLADANASPIRGTDVNGPIAVMKSAMKIHQDNFQAFLFNMKFAPSALRDGEDQAKLASAIYTYLTNGGKMIQFTVQSDEDLIAAKADPENYRDLMVRVAGYSAYFVRLTENIQDELIERTSQVF